MKHLYGKIKMTWLKVILFAIVTGIYTGAVMMISALDGTSFQDIGIGYEWWVIFAVILVVNCKKNREAALKCFVFFAVSQPVVYAVEVIFGHITAELGITYLRMWLPKIILTLPGGFIASYCKKQNALGATVLGLGNAIQLLLGASYLVQAARSFPHHILSAIVCFASVFVMSFYIQHTKKYRRLSLCLPVILLLAALVLLRATGRVLA